MVSLHGLLTKQLNGRRGRVREGQSGQDRYVVDIGGGYTAKVGPASLRIVKEAERASSEWIPWSPPEEMEKEARDAVESIRRMTGEHSEIPVEADALRERCITMFKKVWRARRTHKESSGNSDMLERMRASANTSEQCVICRLVKLIVMSERWTDGCAEKTEEEILMNCARCLEDAIQQRETWDRSVKGIA